jgi:hypothetical protein
LTTNPKQQTTNNKQQTTNNKQQTTNNKQQTTNNKQQTTTPILLVLKKIFQKALNLNFGYIFLSSINILFLFELKFNVLILLT